MKILNIDAYLDGGTIKIHTDDGDYYIDKRLGTVTENQLYLGYPKKDNSNLILSPEVIKNQLLEAIDFFKPQLDWGELKKMLKHE